MSAVRLFIPGEPVPKGRPRAYRMGRGRIGHYTPEKTRNWERAARRVAASAMGSRAPLIGPVRLKVTAVFSPPASWPRWKLSLVANERILPTGRFDADNIVKAVSDALNGVVWEDDAQVVAIEASKRYSAGSVAPGVYAEILPLADVYGSNLTRRPKPVSE